MNQLNRIFRSLQVHKFSNRYLFSRLPQKKNKNPNYQHMQQKEVT